MALQADKIKKALHILVGIVTIVALVGAVLSFSLPLILQATGQLPTITRITNGVTENILTPAAKETVHQYHKTSTYFAGIGMGGLTALVVNWAFTDKKARVWHENEEDEPSASSSLLGSKSNKQLSNTR